MINHETFMSISESTKNSLRTIIDMRRRDLATGNTNQFDPNSMQLEGVRWNDTDRILRRMLDDKFREYKNVDADFITRAIVNMDNSDIQFMVDKELNSARGSDYHYTYEKEW